MKATNAKKSIAISEIKGVSIELVNVFREAGIVSCSDFLALARTTANRKALSGKTHVDVRMLLEIANRCDLTRIRGIAGVYSDLLEEAGIDTVKELSGRVAENLLKKVREVNEAKRLTKRPPSLKLIRNWIEEAKSLDAYLEY